MTKLTYSLTQCMPKSYVSKDMRNDDKNYVNGEKTKTTATTAIDDDFGDKKHAGAMMLLSAQ